MQPQLLTLCMFIDNPLPQMMNRYLQCDFFIFFLLTLAIPSMILFKIDPGSTYKTTVLSLYM